MRSIVRSSLRVVFSGILIVATLPSTPAIRSQQINPHQKRTQPKLATDRSKNTEWYTFKGPDNDFTLDFPVKPKRIEDVQGPVTIIRRYGLVAKSIYFEISFQDTGGVPTSSYANEFSPKFEETTSQMFSEDGIKIVQLRRMTKGSYEMEILSPTLNREDYLHGLRRGIIRNGRIYTMGCGSLIVGQETDRNVCRRFFNSFHIIGLPQ
ncbi:MAG TPA: hypothetical protein VF666_15285 [Pyrinomonadaceae bacterium]|jgi:hypothetical protein